MLPPPVAVRLAAVALVLAAVLARQPEPAAAVLWLVVDLLLLRGAARGSRVAAAVLSGACALGAVLLLPAGLLERDPRLAAAGAALAVALLAVRALRPVPVHS